VYAVDVGYGQIAWSLRQDPRVVVIERTNIRTIDPEKVPEPVDLITIDVSFISLKLVVPAVLRFLKPGGRLLPLVKPQFEVGKGEVGKGWRRARPGPARAGSRGPGAVFQRSRPHLRLRHPLPRHRPKRQPRVFHTVKNLKAGEARF
jgi:hypothetical protein